MHLGSRSSENIVLRKSVFLFWNYLPEVVPLEVVVGLVVVVVGVLVVVVVGVVVVVVVGVVVVVVGVVVVVVGVVVVVVGVVVVVAEVVVEVVVVVWTVVLVVSSGAPLPPLHSAYCASTHRLLDGLKYKPSSQISSLNTPFKHL